MSRTWVRAHGGHSQLRPRLSVVMVHARASSGGASVRGRSQRVQWAVGGSGSSTMGGDLTSGGFSS
jgi:hypothetical protein